MLHSTYVKVTKRGTTHDEALSKQWDRMRKRKEKLRAEHGDGSDAHCILCHSVLRPASQSEILLAYHGKTKFFIVDNSQHFCSVLHSTPTDLLLPFGCN